mgnify:CR=1 FL=1
MLVKHNNVVIDIQRAVDENIETFNNRSIFIVKNLNSGYPIEDITELSYIYNFKQTLQCVYEEKIETVIEVLTRNMFIKL